MRCDAGYNQRNNDIKDDHDDIAKQNKLTFEFNSRFQNEISRRTDCSQVLRS